MAPFTSLQTAGTRISNTLLLTLALILMIAPFIVSVVANIGRRPWPSYRTETAKPKSRGLFAPKGIAA